MTAVKCLMHWYQQKWPDAQSSCIQQHSSNWWVGSGCGTQDWASLRTNIGCNHTIVTKRLPTPLPLLLNNLPSVTILRTMTSHVMIPTDWNWPFWLNDTNVFHAVASQTALFILVNRLSKTSLRSTLEESTLRGIIYCNSQLVWLVHWDLRFMYLGSHLLVRRSFQEYKVSRISAEDLLFWCIPWTQQALMENMIQQMFSQVKTTKDNLCNYFQCRQAALRENCLVYQCDHVFEVKPGWCTNMIYFKSLSKLEGTEVSTLSISWWFCTEWWG